MQTASVAQKLGEGKYGYTQSVSGEWGEEEKPSGDMPTIDFDKNGNKVSVNGELYVFGGQSAKVYSGLADFAGLQFVYSVGEYAGTAESVVDNSLPAALSIVFDTSTLTNAGTEEVNGVACDKYTGTAKFRGVESEYAIWVSDGVTYRYEGLVIGGDFGSAETVICELKFESAEVTLTAPENEEDLIVTGAKKRRRNGTTGCGWAARRLKDSSRTTSTMSPTPQCASASPSTARRVRHGRTMVKRARSTARTTCSRSKA